MAELLLVDEWAEQDPLATHLQDTLPEEFMSSGLWYSGDGRAAYEACVEER